LILPPGFKYSSFAQISAQFSLLLPNSNRRKRTNGVCPTNSKMLSTTFINSDPSHAKSTARQNRTGRRALYSGVRLQTPSAILRLSSSYRD
jgi:hypothetical protein